MDASERRMELIRRYQTNVNTTELKQEKPAFSGGKLRFLLTAVLLVLYFAVVRGELELKGVTSDKIVKTLCEDTAAIDFSALFPRDADDIQ